MQQQQQQQQRIRHSKLIYKTCREVEGSDESNGQEGIVITA
jgi:hypothetical protein